jgi:hypothetical protein
MSNNVRKYGAVIPVSNEVLFPRVRVMTPEEEQRMREHRAKVAVATKAWPVIVAALDAVSDPVARAVLDLHRNNDGWCAGCEGWDNCGESPSWPCGTTTTVAQALGIPGAADMWLAEQARA